jgi:hypothetical protein
MSEKMEDPVFVRFRVDSNKRDRFKIATIRLRTSMDEVMVKLLDSWLEVNDPSAESDNKSK